MKRMDFERTARGGSVFVTIALAVVGCDIVAPEAPDPGDVMDGPLEGLSREEMASFVAGDEEFERSFSPAEGLGPIFNNTGCGSCHSGDGRGRPENILVRFSRGGDLVLDEGGPQLQEKALPGALPETLPDGVDVSPRLPPPVFGVGLIEAIPEEAILALADPDDGDGDGISGRPNYVDSPDWVPASEPGSGTGLQLGRFSRKAQVSTLLQQVVEAYHQDIGITSDFLPVENANPQAGRGAEGADRVADPEIPATTVRAVLAYIRMLAPPEPGPMTPRRVRGREVFTEVGCASCHVPQLETGPSTISAIGHRSVALYSDLLLHEMGPDLADGRPDGDAEGNEWRTAPLWGLRVMRDFLDGDAFLLHDGRATTVEEAILYHGGEADASRAAYEDLPAEDREALLDFVRSR